MKKKLLSICVCFCMIIAFTVPTTITASALSTSDMVSASGVVIQASGKTTAKLNIRKAPDTTAAICSFYSKGQTAYITDKNAKEGWYEVVTGINGHVYKGYSQSQYISSISNVSPNAAPAGAEYVTSLTKNASAKDLGVPVQLKASNSSAVLGIYDNGDVVKILNYDYNKDFAQIDYSGYIGYINKYYVKEVVANQTLKLVEIKGSTILTPGGTFPSDYVCRSQGVELKSTSWNSNKIDDGTTYTLTSTFEAVNGNKFDSNKANIKGHINGNTM